MATATKQQRKDKLGHSCRLAAITDEALINALPHGCGIDSTWIVERFRSGAVLCKNSFHLMDGNGFYDGWQDFAVRLYPVKVNLIRRLSGVMAGKYQVVQKRGDVGFDVMLCGYRIKRRSADGLKDCLEEVISFDLSEADIVTPARSDVVERPTGHFREI